MFAFLAMLYHLSFLMVLFFAVLGIRGTLKLPGGRQLAQFFLFDEYQSVDLGGPSLGYRARFRSNKSLSNISRASSTSSFSDKATPIDENSMSLGKPLGPGPAVDSTIHHVRSMESMSGETSSEDSVQRSEPRRSLEDWRSTPGAHGR
eukprot:g17252.t1